MSPWLLTNSCAIASNVVAVPPGRHRARTRAKLAANFVNPASLQPESWVAA